MKNISKKKTNFFMLFLIIALTVNAKIIPDTNFKEIQVIYVFNNETKKMTHIFLYESVINTKGDMLLPFVEKNSFFTGYIKGDFKNFDGMLLPRKGAMMVILKDYAVLLKDKNFPNILKESLYPGTDKFLPEKKFIPGDMFVIFFDKIQSEIKIEILKNNKSEAVLQVE